MLTSLDDKSENILATKTALHFSMQYGVSKLNYLITRERYNKCTLL